MFRKRHVQISPLALTMPHNDALSFYGKDRHVHGVFERPRHDPSVSTL
jgi:hypothetical protein